MKQIENPLSPTSFLQPWPGWKLCCICTKQRMYLFKFTKKMHFSTIFHQHHYSRHDQTGTQLINPPDCWAQSCVSERKSLQTCSSIGKARHTVCNTVHRAPLCPLFKCIFNRQGWYRTGLQCMKCNDIPLFAVTLHRLRRHKCSLCSAAV